MSCLGWKIIFETDGLIGYTSGKNGDLWFVQSEKNEVSDYDNRGVNHISLQVEESKDVDEVIEFLKSKNVHPLFDTPRHRPEFAAQEDRTYYQVMFATEDNLLFEVVYNGVKTTV